MKNLRILIGHRGVGKTSLLHRLQQVFSEETFFDLDQQIEKHEEKAIGEIFSKSGEAAFRDLELNHLARIIRESSKRENVIWISVGAGFDILRMPAEIRSTATLIWISRKTDASGRSFLNRPRLNTALLPIQEYNERFQIRHKIFQENFDLRFEVPEGFGQSKIPSSQKLEELESNFFRRRYKADSFGFTLQSGDLKLSHRLNEIQQSINNDQFQFVEIRDDLLSEEEIQQTLQMFPIKKTLFSFREKNVFENSMRRVSTVNEKFFGIDFDVDLTDSFQNQTELIQKAHSLFLSSHSSLAPWKNQGAEKFVNDFDNVFYKWSPLAEDFETLSKLSLEAEKRGVSFLPRSENGRWRWFRLCQAPKNLINFVSFTQSSAPDQPSVMEVLMNQNLGSEFAAVLGSPIQQSYSPIFHFDFFHQRKMPFYPIQVEASEADVALQFLEVLGLRAAAVTSPLKEWALKISSEVSPEGQLLQAVNTLSLKNGKWIGDNTDIKGFEKFSEPFVDHKVILWGGGGTKEVVKRIFPQVVEISARHPEIDPSYFDSEWTLIWASARSEETQLPPKNLKINAILDLNYTENSMGLELAAIRACPYFSGIEMFVEQALQQQKIWEDYL